jgi:NAD(P)-dependent dehydrogenase (short-subunit alcohol dehydrogenase family)
MFVPLLFDVTAETAVQLAAEKVDQHLNSAGLDGLVNNACIDCFMALSQ